MDPDTPPETHGKPARAWILEAALIVASVLLAFAMDEYRENRSNHALARRALSGIAAEIAYNDSILEPYVAKHAEWRDALERAQRIAGSGAGLDVWFSTRPSLDGRGPFPVLRRSAWDAAMSSGAMRFIDFDVASALADVYGMQEMATSNVQRLAMGPLASTTTYDPASRNASVRLLWLTLADIQAAEASLSGLYKRHLPGIRSVATK